MIKLNEVYSIDDGVFASLSDFTLPWDEDINAEDLDLVYIGNVSGCKPVSPMVHSLIEDGELSDTNKGRIATSIMALYLLKWAKLWNTLTFEYNPIENYDMEEVMSDDVTEIEYGHVNETAYGHVNETAYGHVNELVQEKGSTTTRTDAITVTDTHSVQGFNSSDYTPADRNVKTPSGNETIVGSGEDTNTNTESGTDTRTESGSDTNTESGTDTHTRNYTLTRHGNIGVTTSQQMIESERMLWMWSFFYEVVFPDIDRLLCLSIY